MKQIGGQALEDGILMIGKKCTAIVKRKSSGRIDVETRDVTIIDEEKKSDKIFLLRGINKFLGMIKNLLTNLNLIYSKNKFLVLVGSILFFLLMFILLPEIVANLMYAFNVKNFLIIGVVKFLIRISLLLFVCKNKKFATILKYHGAEHKVINCYESGGKLDIENIKNFSVFHLRCSSGLFLYITVFYFLIFLFIRRFNIVYNLLIEILIFPLIVGISYEIVRYMCKKENAFSNILFFCSKWIQRLVIKEPDVEHIEVAMLALKVCEGIKTGNNVKELFLKGRGILREAGINTYSLDARLIIEYCLGILPTHVFTSEAEVSKDDEQRYLSLIEQRKSNKPIAYIIGKKEFYGMDFVVKEGVLIPRPDTEVLVEKVLKIFENRKDYNSICDLCSGTGAVGISIQKNNDSINCTYIDNFDIPLKVTNENINLYELKSRSYVVKSNLLEFFIENNLELDGIVSNPPYIDKKSFDTLMKDVKDYEPYEALYGGEDGLDYYRKICSQAKQILIDDGFLAFEIPFNKAFDIMNIMINNNFVDIDIYKDINEKDRVIIGYYKSSDD